jgi:hypothetical protein
VVWSGWLPRSCRVCGSLFAALALALITAASPAAAGPRAGAAAATFTARGSVEQVYVLGLGLGPRQRPVGSRIRVTIAAPNGTQPIWAFSQTSPRKSATVAIAFARRMPSRLILPVVPGVSVPTGLPPCRVSGASPAVPTRSS